MTDKVADVTTNDDQSKEGYFRAEKWINKSKINLQIFLQSAIMFTFLYQASGDFNGSSFKNSTNRRLCYK